jgi:hypothetical protein
MGGVDKADQLRQYYNTSRRALKWWRYLFWFFVDISIINAHILMQLAPNHPNISQLSFRIELIKGLLVGYSSSRYIVSQGTLQEGHWPIKITKGRCKVCLKSKTVKFCTQGCEKCGIRIRKGCFKNHNKAQ